MEPSANALRWDGAPGHYEVYYLSATDPASGVGLWIRYTMLAPVEGGDPPTCALWLMAMDPSGDEAGRVLARQRQWPAAALAARPSPFRLTIDEATLDDRGMKGAFDDVAWDLSWEPTQGAYHHVHPILRRARLAQTILTLPHADLLVRGSVTLAGRTLQLDGARGGQAHLWGSKHAQRWAWLHCNDLRRADGTPADGSFIDGVSVHVSRFGREVGPSTPVVGRLLGEDFQSTSPVRVLRNRSRFDVDGWELEAQAGRRRVRAEVRAPRELMVGVTYHDPDGALAYCYNTEVASLTLTVWDGDELRETLHSDAGAHFEYAQRAPLEHLALHIR